jgi:hypothetical protein
VGGQHTPTALPPEDNRYPLYRWASEPAWMCPKNLTSTGVRSPDYPARRESLYRLTASQELQKGLPEVLARRIGACTVLPVAHLAHHHSQRTLLHLQLTGHFDVQVGDDSQRENVPGTRRVAECLMSVCATVASVQSLMSVCATVASVQCLMSICATGAS